MKVQKYQRQYQPPASTGQTTAPLNLTTNRGLEALGQGVQNLAAGMGEAQRRNQARQDVVVGSRAMTDFRKKLSELDTEFQEVDMADANNLRDYNLKLGTLRNLALNGQDMSDDAKVKLQAQIEDLAMSYETNAVINHRNAQIQTMENAHREMISPIIKGINEGSIELQDGIDQYRALKESDAYNALPFERQMALDEAVNAEMAIGAVESHLISGDWEAAINVINDTHEFSTLVGDEKLGNLVRRANAMQKASDIAVTNARNQDNMTAQKLGYDSWNDMPPQYKRALVFGTDLPTAPAPMSEIGKQEWDRQNAVTLYGEGSPQVQRIDDGIAKTRNQAQRDGVVGLIDQKEEIISGLQEQGKTPAEIANDDRVKALDDEINSKSPDFKRLEGLRQAQPKAEQGLSSAIQQYAVMAENAERAILEWTGMDNIKDAREAIKQGEFGYFTTGAMGQAASMFWSSDINEIDATLDQIRSSQLITTLNEMKSNSPTGASGMGALSQSEGQLLQSLEGSLRIDSPKTTANTLLSIIDGMEANVTSLIDGYNGEYGEILTTPMVGGSANAGDNSPNIPTNNAPSVVFDVNGNPIQ